MPATRYHHASDLPETIAVFPLGGALLLPRWQLPLNIFEPRYLNMVDDAMAGSRLIGMIQPVGGPKDKPVLAGVGCAGRITTYSETDDGRYLLTLTGICRFRLMDELEVKTPYRQVEGDFSRFEADLGSAKTTGLPSRETLERALRAYAKSNQIDADWDAVSNAPMETLINALSAGCPFDIMEKQALIEAADLPTRCDTLIKLLTLNCENDDGPLQ
ncbi:MAG: LON peptidase substrate-binding domain-containing protein [Pseudomonadota bacterium]